VTDISAHHRAARVPYSCRMGPATIERNPFMVDTKKPFETVPPAAGVSKERRRISTVVHDHKGNATVEWRDAPPDYERPTLEIEGARQVAKPKSLRIKTGPLELEYRDTHDPYKRVPESRKSGATRTDLRKLSEWIKMMRELEDKKRDGSIEEE
jgi:hypothetical protein